MPSPLVISEELLPGQWGGLGCPRSASRLRFLGPLVRMDTTPDAGGGPVGICRAGRQGH